MIAIISGQSSSCEIAVRVLSPICRFLTEATFLLRFSVEAQRDLLSWAHRALDIDQGTAADLPRIASLLDKYRDMPADFADASLVALAERLNLSRVASVDSDFAVYRTLGRRAFENVFLLGD
jgi:uncharacterized protein